MALGVKTAGLHATPPQAAVPHTTHQMVVDVAVACGGNKHQSIRLIHTQLLHLLLVLSHHLQHLSGQGHHSLSACFGRRPAVMP